MKYTVRHRIEGSISVLLVIILLVTMVFSGLIVDTSRINMARSMVSSAGDLALNSALADYDTVLKDVYGLFAMSQAKNSEELVQEIQEYFERTLVSYGVTSEAEAGDYVSELMGNFNELLSGTGSMEVSNFLNMEIGADFAVTKVDASGLDNPEILRRQIVDYMKYRAPVNFGLSFLDSVKAFTSVSDQAQVVQAQVAAQESLQPVTQGCRTVIDGIRAYDAKVLAINSGDQAVTGKENSTDSVTVEITAYHEQLDKYKQVWGENYANINELALIFLLKATEATDKYLSNMNYAAGEYFIHDSTIEVTGSGISVDVTLAEDYEAAANQVADQRERLQDVSRADSYMQLQNIYRNAEFLSRDNLNYNKTDYTDRDAAIEAFILYEAFLLDDATRVQITYSQAAEILEQLYILEKYQTNYMTLMEKHIAERTAVRDAKKQEMQRKEQDVEQAASELEEANKAKEAVRTAQSALETAGKACDTAQAELTAAENALSAYTGKTNTKEYRRLQEAVETAQSTYDDAQAEEDAAQDVYDRAKTAEPSAEQLAQLAADLAKKEAEYVQLESEYIELRDEVALLESDKSSAEANYGYALAQYEAFTDAYQRQMERYEDYREVARKLIAKDAAAIQAQALKIQQNIKSLMDDLSQIAKDLEKLRGYVETYSDNVEVWETANNGYVDNHSADTFSKQNTADIASTESQYNLDSLNTLLAYVQSLEEKYNECYTYITDADHYRYGSARVDSMSTSEEVLQAVSAEIKTVLPEIVTKEDAYNQLDALYPQEPTPALAIEQATFVTNRVLPIQFLKYLNENFPVEASDIMVKENTDGSTEGPEEQYDSLKEQMKEDKEGENKINDTEGDAYEYTFKDVGTLDLSVLPSHRTPADSSNCGNTESMSISEDADGNVNASDSLGKQNEGLDNVLGNVEKVLEAGLENVYILDYIFENFSYNTMIQELVVDGEKLDSYPEVIALASNDQLANYRGTAKTLSNYSILGANNYLYGAEIEYILWGNENPKMNVTYTKGSIYAIRFAFNCIFAFTNSEIRNNTRAVGLAVQAATAGLVPYQVVQVVLQLALAAAESAIDLDMMSKGLKVVVVKTKDTWSMSMSGAIGLLKDTAETIAEQVISEAVTSAINCVNEGINTVVDATAEELGDAVDSLTDTVSNAAKSKGQEIVDGIYTELQSEVENLLNELQFLDYSTIDGEEMTREQLDAKVNELFAELRGRVDGITARYAGNPIADEIMSAVLDGITGPGGIIEEVQGKINNTIDGTYADMSGRLDIGGKICGAMTQIKYDVIMVMQEKIGGLEKSIDEMATNCIADTAEELKKYAAECVTEAGEELEETLVTAVKDKVVTSLDNFSNTYLKDAELPDMEIGNGGTAAGTSSGSDIASMIKFGYKDYLMLFVFIQVCVNDDATLCRTADLIQLNMQHAIGPSEQSKQLGQVLFAHKRGADFTMAEAKTYVMVQGSVQLDMLFLDMDFFRSLLVEEGTDIEEQISSAATIPYKGLAGY